LEGDDGNINNATGFYASALQNLFLDKNNKQGD
jgi:hypothetical protein